MSGHPMQFWDLPPETWPDGSGARESDADRRLAWCARSGLEIPAWCARDPRLDAASVLVCAALDRLAGGDGIARASDEDMATAMRLHHPGEFEERICEPMARLVGLGIVTRLASGGWLLKRLRVAVEQPLDEADPTELLEWANALDERDRLAVLRTLAAMTNSEVG